MRLLNRVTAQSIIASLAVAVCTPLGRGEDLRFGREHHPWGGFPVGAWKLVRTTSQSLDEKGRVVSVTITDTRTTLEAADQRTYTLRTQSSVEVASRRISSLPQSSKHGYYGENPDTAVSVKRLGDASLTIGGKSITCEVGQATISKDNKKLVCTLHFSPDVSPHVLRRETVAEASGEEKSPLALVEVVALDLPHRVRGELKTTSLLKTTQKTPQSAKVTLEVHCDEVPGGVAAHWASETDTAGRVIRRSVLELIDFGVPSPDTQSPPVLLRRPYRPAKAARRIDQR